LSTLTKILIVLLTIASIFLCGIVVTYVANADNYRDKYTKQKSERDGLKEKTDSLTEQLNNKIAEKNALEDKLSREIAALNKQITTLQDDLKKVNDENKILVQRVTDMASVVETSSQTTGTQGQLLKETLAELNTLQAQQIKLSAQLDDTSETLLEKLAIIQTLETEKKRLTEEKLELQGRLGKILQPTGKTPAPVTPVTPQKDVARPAPVIAKDIALKGLVSAVDLKNKMASISIGSADGVKDGMKFHVTRGDKFICDILIIDTDTEEAVGALELMQEQPKAGDTVSTNL
jgi:septal ring factor EnvC (AmiA/AmiB activator)